MNKQEAWIPYIILYYIYHQMGFHILNNEWQSLIMHKYEVKSKTRISQKAETKQVKESVSQLHQACVIFNSYKLFI